MQEAVRLREKYNQTQKESDKQAADQAELNAITKNRKHGKMHKPLQLKLPNLLGLFPACWGIWV